MAKQKNGALVRYHNLAGFMRDLRKALDNGDIEAYELAELIIEVDGLVDEQATDGGGEDDLPDDAVDGDTSTVDGGGAALRQEADARPSGHAERRLPRGTAASVLDRALDGLAGKERVEAQRELDLLRVHSVGAPRVAALPQSGDRRGKV